MSEDKSDTVSDTESDNVEDETPDPKPEALEVKITNVPVKDTKWNDDRDDIEYDEIIITKEEMDI